MPSFPMPLKILVAVAAATVPLAFGVAPAAAKTPCWKKLFLDYSDGRIDKTYPVHCYRDAVRHLHEDELVYGSAADDINRALLSAIRKIKHSGRKVGPNTLVQPLRPARVAQQNDTPATDSRKHGRGFFGWLADKIGPGSASSIPLPLLVLAGLGLLLVAAAGASFAARRIQARRAQPAPAASPPPRRRE